MSDRSARRSPTKILAAWRAAEARLAEVEEGGADWHRTRMLAEDLAREYQQAIAERKDEAAELGGHDRASADQST